MGGRRGRGRVSGCVPPKRTGRIFIRFGREAVSTDRRWLFLHRGYEENRLLLCSMNAFNTFGAYGGDQKI